MTLRQEIEKLISDLTKMHIERIDHPNDYVRGRGDGIELAVDNLTDILSRHTEHEQTAPFNPKDELKAIQEWIKDNPEQHEKILDEINAQPNIGPTAQEMLAIMRCDHPEPTAPSQRERIATAIQNFQYTDIQKLKEILKKEGNQAGRQFKEWSDVFDILCYCKKFDFSEVETHSILSNRFNLTAADALIAELSKTTA